MKAYINSTLAKQLIKVLNHKHKDLHIERLLHITPRDKSVVFQTFNGKENIRVEVKTPMNKKDDPFAVELDPFLTAVKSADKDQLIMLEPLTTVKGGKDGYTKHYTVASFFSDGFASAVELPGIPATHEKLDYVNSAFETPEHEPFYNFLFNENIKDKFHKICKFASTDTTRYVLNGIHLHEGRVVATDGRRIMIGQTDFNQQITCTIPSHIVKILHSLPQDTEGVFNILCFKNKEERSASDKFEFFSDCNSDIQVSINGDLIQGNYPNYKQVIPAEQPTTVTFSDVKALHKLLKANNKKSANLNSVQFTFDDKKPTICHIRVNSVTVTASVHIQGPIPKKTLFFNPGFMADKFDYGFFSFSMRDELSPITFLNPQGDLGVVMPMRIPS